MEKREKHLFTASGVIAAILSFSAVMGLQGAWQSEGGFSLFGGICIFSLVSLVFLALVLFFRKKNLLLTLALGLNTLVSLLTVIFFFTVHELLLCLLLLLLTVNSAFSPKNVNKTLHFSLSLLGSLLVLYAIVGFSRNILSAMEQAENGNLLFDFTRWIYYFSPFLFSSLYATLGNLLGISFNESPHLRGKLSLPLWIPLFFILGTTVLSAVPAVLGVTLNAAVYSFPRILLLLCQYLAMAALLFTPFLLVLFPTPEPTARS